MTATKHTPRPESIWQIIPEESADSSFVCVRDRHGNLIARSAPFECGHRKTIEANARLIAAAPQLLGAILAAIPSLENIAEEERSFWGNTDKHGIATEAEKILAQARAAIASATE